MENEKNAGMGVILEKRMKKTEGSVNADTYDVSDNRLKEMNKKLPAWSLEPPFGFLK